MTSYFSDVANVSNYTYTYTFVIEHNNTFEKNNHSFHVDLLLFAFSICTSMGVGSGGQGGHGPLWIFLHGTDIVDRGLIMLFSVFFAIFRSFSVAPPLEIFLPTPLCTSRYIQVLCKFWK